MGTDTRINKTYQIRFSTMQNIFSVFALEILYLEISPSLLAQQLNYQASEHES